MPLENYVLGKVIGKGSYGEVSLAKHKRDKKQYVIKKIDLHEASEKERTFSEQEVQILAKLRHPNIVSYKESFQSQDGFLHIVMGYCEGGDLYTKLKEYGKNNEYLSERQIVEWFVQIAMALQYMHDRNILHRDLKTQNIFLTKSKIIKIGDLGIARVLESTSDMATTLIGTPYYMSPELFSNKPYNHRSDVWALGCCVYEMTTLKHAFNARDMNALVYKILKGKTPPMPKQYSEELCGIIKSMLAYNPTERPSASKILRHPFVKKHIAIFLEGTKSRKEEKEKRSPSVKSKRSSVTDSGYSGSNEINPEAIATASGVDIDILNEDRKDKYIVKSSESKDEKPNRHEKVAKKPSKERRSRPHADKDKVVQPTTEASQDSVTHKNSRQVSDLRQKSPRDQHMSEKEAKDNEKRIPLEEREVQSEKKLVRVKSSDSKDVEPVKRASRKSKKSHGSSPFDKPIAVKEPRPLPPTPSDSPSSQARERCLTDPATPNDDAPSQVSIQQQQVGVPNISARQKRRMRLKEEEKMAPAVGRKSSKTHSNSPNIQKSVLKSKSKKQQSLDSVDGPLKSQSEEDSNSELEEVSRKPMDKYRPNSPPESGEQSSGDIVDLIGTMQATLNLEPKQRSSRSDTPSPEESLAIDSGLKELSPTLSGRLNGRIERLRRECIRGVGEVMLRKAFEILDTVDDDDLENAFISLLGQKNFELFGDPIRQLKFCEEFAQHSM